MQGLVFAPVMRFAVATKTVAAALCKTPVKTSKGMDRILLDRLIQYAENKAGYKLDSKQEEGPSLPRFINPG